MQNRIQSPASPQTMPVTAPEIPVATIPTNLESTHMRNQANDFPPPGSPQRGQMSQNLRLAIDKASNSPPSSVDSQPSTPKQNIGSHREFLEGTMARPDLADLGDFFCKHTKQWAFIGSVAMQIHGHDLQSDRAKNWQPGDADILTTGVGQMAIARQPVPSTNPDEPVRYCGPVFYFTETLKVDVLADTLQDHTFKGLETETIRIGGVAVLTIAALIRLKESALAHAEQEDESKEGEHSETIQKIKANLSVLKELRDLSEARRLQASTNSWQVQPENPSSSNALPFQSQELVGNPAGLATLRRPGRGSRILDFSARNA